MILSRKIRLLPNKEQEIMFFKHINYTRFIYNWGLETWNNLYQNGEKCGITIDRDFNASINLSNYDINWKKVS